MTAPDPATLERDKRADIRKTRADLARLAELRPEIAADCNAIGDNLALLAIHPKDAWLKKLIGMQVAKLTACDRQG